MYVLIEQMRDEFEREYTKASREEAYRYAVEAFRRRNIKPTEDLVDSFVDYLVTGVPIGRLTPLTSISCGC